MKQGDQFKNSTFVGWKEPYAQPMERAISDSGQSTGSISQELKDSLTKFYNDLRDEQKTLDDLGLKIVDEGFWDLLA